MFKDLLPGYGRYWGTFNDVFVDIEVRLGKFRQFVLRVIALQEGRKNDLLIYWFIDLLIYWFIYLFIDLLIYWFIYLLIYLFIYSFIYLFLSLLYFTITYYYTILLYYTTITWILLLVMIMAKDLHAGQPVGCHLPPVLAACG